MNKESWTLKIKL